jgi:hypothetical protein
VRLFIKRVASGKRTKNRNREAGWKLRGSYCSSRCRILSPRGLRLSRLENSYLCAMTAFCGCVALCFANCFCLRAFVCRCEFAT